MKSMKLFYIIYKQKQKINFQLDLKVLILNLQNLLMIIILKIS